MGMNMILMVFMLGKEAVFDMMTGMKRETCGQEPQVRSQNDTLVILDRGGAQLHLTNAAHVWGSHRWDIWHSVCQYEATRGQDCPPLLLGGGVTGAQRAQLQRGGRAPLCPGRKRIFQPNFRRGIRPGLWQGCGRPSCWQLPHTPPW